MSRKVLKALVALLATAALVSPAFAEDRLSLNGEMRVRGWHMDNGGTTTTTYADQRLRVGGKLSVAEGVSVTFRTDITESVWGSGNVHGSGRTTVNNSDFQSQHWDRAHLDLSKGDLSLRAGQQLILLGSTAFDAQTNGVMVSMKGAIPVSAFFMVTDDNDTAAVTGTTYTDSNGDTVTIPATTAAKSGSDATLAGLSLGHKTDAYDAKLYVANQNNGAKEDVYVIGTTLSTALGGVKLAGELDYFTGDASATVDAMGLQLFLDGSVAASETAAVGAQFFYAQGKDDATEKQYQMLGTGFNGWDPIMDLGNDLSNESISFGRPFDFTGDQAGVIGGRLYTKVKASDDLSLGASVAYLTPEEDANTTTDSTLALAGGLSYTILPNASFQAQVQYVDEDAPSTDEKFQVGTGLFVKF